MTDKYVDEEEFYNEILESQKNGKFTKRAGEILLDMAKRLLRKIDKKLMEGIDEDDVITYMVIETQNQLKGFNPNFNGKKTTAFSYFGQVLRCSLVYKCTKIKNEKLKIKNEFDERGLEILRKLLPDCVVEKENDSLTVKLNEKTTIIKANFEQLFRLIDDDRLLRQIDSGEWYWELFGKTIKREIEK